MNPGQVIEEVNAEVNNYEARIHAPKYWDDERERVEFGVRCRPPQDILADVDAYMGIYPLVSTTILSQAFGESEAKPIPLSIKRRERTDGEYKTFVESYPELCGLLKDPEATLCLWLIPREHSCVPKPILTSSVVQDEEASPHSPEPDLGSALKPEGPPHDSAHKGDHDAPKEGSVCSFKGEIDSLRGRIIRIALDFKTGRGKPIRRTGTVLSPGPEIAPTDVQPQTNDSAFALPVCWDNRRWFNGARVGLSFTVECSSTGSDGDGRPFACLVWTCQPKLRYPGMELIYASEKEESGWHFVSMLGKKLQNMCVYYPLSTVLTFAEAKALGVGWNT
ncbi:hypothetical protein C8Q74DRAFT_1367353 [Fomes fomentarius]|nr:hypothetical protein C8Q74DRAFT_1367353 [Fomes fomentarius]